MAIRQESLDTNILLRLLLREIPNQYEKAKRLIETPGVVYHVADVAIMEFIYALKSHYNFSRSRIGELVYGVMSIDNISCNKSLLKTAIDKYQKRPALSFEDCYLAAVAGASEAVPLWTFDKKLARQSGVAKELV